MKKFWIALFFLVLTCLSINIPAIKTNARIEELVTNCKAAYLCDFHSGTVLYKQNEEQHLPIASMCKIMTLLLCFEAKEKGLSFDKEITVSKNASSMGGSQVFLAADKKYKIAELVKSITIASANDSCVAMAEEVAGSEESFIQKMNARAKELGMYNTVFVNCTGLPKDGQYSCAKDVSIMLRELLKHKDYYTFSSIWMQDFKHEGDRVTQMANTNKLIRHYQGCDAGKTGYTAQAGFCLAASALRGNMRVVSVIIGGKDSKSRFENSEILFDYAFNNYINKVVLEDKVLTNIECKIVGGKKTNIAIRPKNSVFIFCKKDDTDKIFYELVLNNNIKAPIKIGDSVGSIIVYKNNIEYSKVEVIANENLDKLGYYDSIKKILLNYNFNK